ncbi:MAG: PqiC family protein [Methylococcaceae bacterium]
MSNNATQVLAILAVLMLSACAETPSPKFYVLESLSPPAAPVIGGANKRSIGIGPVTIPSLLERRQIVTQTGDNNVDIAEFHQWAAPIKDNIIQVLQQNLAALLPHDICQIISVERIRLC